MSNTPPSLPGNSMHSSPPLAAGSLSSLICAVGGQCSQSYGGCWSPQTQTQSAVAREQHGQRNGDTDRRGRGVALRAIYSNQLSPGEGGGVGQGVKDVPGI